MMLLDWIILTLLLILPFLVAISGKRSKEKVPANRSFFYLKDIVGSFVLLLFFFFVNPKLYDADNISTIDKGINISESIFSGLISIFFVPFFLSFTPWNNNYPKDISAAKELFGFPVTYLPNTFKEFFLFVFYIIVGVFFEELLCRQFLFYSLNKTLHLGGDALVIISSLLFAVGHLYQGWKGVFSSFIIGLILGKIFLLKGTLAYPIVLHLFLNLTGAVLAFRRLKDLKRKNNQLHDVC